LPDGEGGRGTIIIIIIIIIVIIIIPIIITIIIIIIIIINNSLVAVVQQRVHVRCPGRRLVAPLRHEREGSHDDERSTRGRGGVLV
jgi:hypothetical protein